MGVLDEEGILNKANENSSENNLMAFAAFNKKKALIGRKNVQSVLLIQQSK